MAKRKKVSENIPVEDTTARVIEVAKPGVELGSTGTLITHGIITGADYARELTGLEGIKAYEEMRNDATVNASLDVLKLPILAANWYIEAGSDTDEIYEEHAAFIKQELFSNLDHTFTEFLREALLYLDYGRYAFEIVYRLREDGKLGWQKFAARMPKTIYYWETDDQKPGIKQLLPDGKHSSIPIEKLIIFTNRKEGDNHEGRSILRSSYRNWYTKDTLYKIQAIALERQGVGIPYVKTPASANKRDIAKAEEFLKNLRANEEAFLSWKEGWEFGFMDMHSNGMDPTEAINHHNREIVKNVLAQFLELGAGGSKGGSSGSHALSKDQSRLLILSLQYIANYCADIITKEASKRLIEINFGPQEYYPKVKVSKIGETDFAAIATALNALVTAQVITPDPGLEDHLRDDMNLPPMPESFRAEKDFQEFDAKLEVDDQMLQAQEDQAAAQDQAESDQQQAAAESTPTETPAKTAEEVMTLNEVMGVVFTGAAGVPLSEEHRQNISVALTNYWASRKKIKEAKKGRKAGKGKSKTSAADKAAKKAKSTEAKGIRASRKASVSSLRIGFRKLRMASQQKILERKMKGDNPTKEEYAKMKLDLLKAQSVMLDKIDKINSETDKKIATITGSEELHMPSVIKLKEEVDNVIEQLKKDTAGATD